jgi:hypothetical protein
MEMTMSTHHSNTASDWLGHAEMPEWTKQLSNSVRTVFAAMATGRRAAHDYKMLTAHGLSPQQATDQIFQKHFAQK